MLDVFFSVLASNQVDELRDRIDRNTQIQISDGKIDNWNLKLYSSAINNAKEYPKKWLDNRLSASVLATLQIEYKPVILDIEVLAKSQSIPLEELYKEVYTTIYRASKSFPSRHPAITLKVPIAWSIG